MKQRIAQKNRCWGFLRTGGRHYLFLSVFNVSRSENGSGEIILRGQGRDSVSAANQEV